MNPDGDSEFAHAPVMLPEVGGALRLVAGGWYVDGTIGGAGHALMILKESAPDGRLFGCDQDEEAVKVATERLAGYAGRFEIRRGRFDELPDWVPFGSCDGVLMDLGVSSPQLDRSERGFSFLRDGPLDMRMDQRLEFTAAWWVNESPVEELARIFWELGGERESRRIARAIVHERKVCRFETTRQLAGLVEKVVPRHGQKTHPATRVFQALRMAVNDELGTLERGLPAVWKLLKPGGRLVVITFHSIEDRLVKEFGRELARDYTVPGGVDVPELRQPKTPELRLVARKAIQPSDAEIAGNPRARSAKLRVMEKI
jgi:16S rRNA (cytosine1402-N4)-methyltransferase